MQALHRVAQALGDFFRRSRRAILQQDAEFVAAQARQGVALTQVRLQQRADMPQQLISRRMAAGVVDQLELVEVEEHQRMPPTLRLLRHVQDLFQPVFKFAAVGQAGQGVMRGLPRQVGNVLALLGHIVQHQHRTADFAGASDRCAHQGDGYRTAVQALDGF